MLAAVSAVCGLDSARFGYCGLILCGAAWLLGCGGWVAVSCACS